MICKFCGHVYITPCHGKNEGCGNQAYAEMLRKQKQEKTDEVGSNVSGSTPKSDAKDQH